MGVRKKTYDGGGDLTDGGGDTTNRPGVSMSEQQVISKERRMGGEEEDECLGKWSCEKLYAVQPLLTEAQI